MIIKHEVRHNFQIGELAYVTSRLLTRYILTRFIDAFFFLNRFIDLIILAYDFHFCLNAILRYHYLVISRLSYKVNRSIWWFDLHRKGTGPSIQLVVFFLYLLNHKRL